MNRFKFPFVGAWLAALFGDSETQTLAKAAGAADFIERWIRQRVAR